MIKTRKKNKLSHRKFIEILHRPELTAEAANLIYIKDTNGGIERLKKEKGFSYMLKNSIVKDKSVLERIKKLAIPPACENVWICHYETANYRPLVLIPASESNTGTMSFGII